jgi:hypothetical protein
MSAWISYLENDQHDMSFGLIVLNDESFYIDKYNIRAGREFINEGVGSRLTYVPPKRRYLPTSPHDVTTQKTNIDIFTAVRILDLIF